VPIDEMPGHLFKNLLKLLFHPFQFFEGMPEHPRLLPPLLLVLGMCLAQILWYFPVFVVFTEQLLGGAHLFTQGGALWTIVHVTISPAIRWLIFTAVIFAVSVLFQGKGSFLRFLVFTVYGTLVAYMSGLVQIAFIHLAGRQLTHEMFHEMFRLMMGSYLSFPNFDTDPTIAIFWMIFWLIGTIGFVWTFTINVAATQYGRYIPRTHAFFTVILAFVCMYGIQWVQELSIRHMIT
jgi:hypothetical protein